MDMRIGLIPLILGICAALVGCGGQEGFHILDGPLQQQMGLWVEGYARKEPALSGQIPLLCGGAQTIRTDAPRFSPRTRSFFWKGSGWSVQFTPDETRMPDGSLFLKRPEDVRVFAIHIAPDGASRARRVIIHRDRIEAIANGPTAISPHNLATRKLTKDSHISAVVGGIVEQEEAFWGNAPGRERLLNLVQSVSGRSKGDAADGGSFRWSHGALEVRARCAHFEGTPTSMIIKDWGAAPNSDGHPETTISEGRTIARYTIMSVTLLVHDRNGKVVRQLIIRQRDRAWVRYERTVLSPRRNRDSGD
jgi:hypothetical protein